MPDPIVQREADGAVAGVAGDDPQIITDLHSVGSFSNARAVQFHAGFQLETWG